MGNLSRKLLPAGFLTCFFLTLAAGQYRFDSWTTDNGLPQNGVRAIVQTPDGYLWFTTFDGLVRFDGLKFTVFDKGNTKGIINNRFYILFAATDGTLWTATEDGSMTIYRNGIFTSYDRDQVPGSSITSFGADATGETRILTDKGYYYFREGQFVFSAPVEPEDPQKRIYNGKSGAKWTITSGEVRQLKDGREVIYPINIKNISKVDVLFSCYEDRQGSLWLGELGVIYNFREGRITYYEQKDGIPVNTYPHAFLEDAEGDLWFATGDQNLAGVGLFQVRGGRLHRFGMEAGLSNDRVMSVFKDREGTIWIATNKGLNRMRREIITHFSTKEGLIHDEVYPILQDLNNEILIGTADGVSRYKDGKFVNDYLANPQGDHGNVQALFEDAGGRLFVGVVGGSFIYDNGRKTLTNDSTVAVISADRSGTVWIGAVKGLTRISDDKIIAHYTTNEGLAGNDVKAIHEDKNGTVWFGTYDGLSGFKDEKFTNYTTKDGLASNRIRSITEDADGTLWIGTYDGGLSRFKDGKFFNFTVDNGLFNNGVFATLEDNNGNFWISCNKGIYRVNKQQLIDFADGRIARYESFAYGREDGMLTTECNGGRQPSALKDKDGKLWFPTLEGVVVVNPDLIRSNLLPPPVVIETVAIDREPETEEKLQSAIHNSQSAIIINSSQTSLDITYTGLSFINSSQIHFKYKLEGLDKDWVNAGTRRTVNYSYLPPGEYTFTVIAANSDGVWNNEGESINILVLSPFYRTWRFGLLASLCVIVIIFLIYRNRVAQLRKIHAAREAFSQQLVQSQELFSRQLIESQEQERKRIAAELHDSLGQNLLVIKNRAVLGLTVIGQDRTKEQFREIQDSVTEALSEVRSIAYNLRPLHLERLGLTSTLEEMIEEVEATSGIKINCDIAPIDNLFTKENEINFYRIVQECLNNIVKHSRAEKASITTYREKQNIFLIVKDNGHGFDLENLSGHHGLGLNGIAERVKILGGNHSIEALPGKGTTISIVIGIEEK